MDIGFLRPDPESNAQFLRARHARAAVLYGGLSVLAVPLASAIRTLLERIRQRRRRRQTILELNALGDTELKDIGLRRSDIEHVADALASRPSDAALRLADLPDRRPSDSSPRPSRSGQTRSGRHGQGAAGPTKLPATGTCRNDMRAAS